MTPGDAWALAYGRYVVGAPKVVSALVAGSPFASRMAALGVPAAERALATLAALGVQTLSGEAGAAAWTAWASAAGAPLANLGTTRAGLAAQLGVALGEVLLATEAQAALLTAGKTVDDAAAKLVRTASVLRESAGLPLLPAEISGPALALADRVRPVSDVSSAVRIAGEVRKVAAELGACWAPVDVGRPPEEVASFGPLGALRSDSARLTWAVERPHDPLATWVVAAVAERAWARAGRRGPPPNVRPPPPEIVAALTQALEGAMAAHGVAAACSGGLVESVTTTADHWLASSARLLAEAPVHHLRVTGGDVAALVRSTTLSALTALDLSETALRDDDVVALACNPAAADLSWLDLSGTSVGEAGIAALAARLPELVWLGLPPGNDPRDTWFDDDPTRPDATPAGLALEAVHGPRAWLHPNPLPGETRMRWDELPAPVGREPRKLGVFQELPHTGPRADAPRLADARRANGPADEADIVRYLASCPIWYASPGRIRDPLDPAQPAATGSIRTDGSYTWTEDLAGYVERYHVALPEAFLAHGRAAGWCAPETVALAALRYPT